MKNWIKILIVALCLTASLASHAQTTTELKPDETQSLFSFSASLLTRGELRDGGMIAEEGRANPNDMAAFVVHRLRLPIDFSRGILTLHFAPQHTGIWGVATQGNFNLFEGWAELRSPKGLFLKVGRQALAYDDERIIGSDDWT